MDILQSKGTRFNVTAAAAGGSAVATQAASTGKTHYITDITASSNHSTCLVEVLDGNTVVWRSVIGSGGYIDRSFVVPIAGTSGNAIKIQAGTTTTSYINLNGYTI